MSSGWAKARLRRAHHTAAPIDTLAAARCRFAHRYDSSAASAASTVSLRPQPLPARRLRRVVRGRKIRPRIGPHDHGRDVVKSVRRIDVVAVRRAADSDLRIPGQEAVDAVGRASERRIGQAMLFRIPEMDARLVARLDPDAERVAAGPAIGGSRRPRPATTYRDRNRRRRSRRCRNRPRARSARSTRSAPGIPTRSTRPAARGETVRRRCIVDGIAKRGGEKFVLCSSGVSSGWAKRQRAHHLAATIDGLAVGTARSAPLPTLRSFVSQRTAVKNRARRKPDSQVQTGWLRMPRSHEPTTASARPTRSSIGNSPTPPSRTGDAAVGGVVAVVADHEQSSRRHRHFGRVVEPAIVAQLEDRVRNAVRAASRHSDRRARHCHCRPRPRPMPSGFSAAA